MSVDYVSIGKRIQAKRKSQNKTQEALAEAIEVTVGYISQIERGISKVNLETMSNIAEILGCDITEFLTGATKNTTNYLSDDINKIFGKLNATNKKTLVEISEVLLKNQ